jgi:AcrR family transcriptional regulator
MPKIVDHEERRREVTLAAARIVIESGRSALTARNVAQATGWSTTVVSHYFDDMADLFHETYSLAAQRSRRRIDAVLSRDPGDVIGLIEAVLPLDEERREDWKIWFAFWSEALSQPKYASEQSERARTTRERIRKCLSVRQQRGDIAANADIAAASDRLSVLIPGIASSAIFDPKTWTPTRQRTTLRNELLLIGLT